VSRFCVAVGEEFVCVGLVGCRGSVVCVCSFGMAVGGVLCVCVSVGLVWMYGDLCVCV
jgi:hypothetical protein